MPEKRIGDFWPYLSEDGIWSHPDEIKVDVVDKTVFGDIEVSNLIRVSFDDNEAHFTRDDAVQLIKLLLDAVNVVPEAGLSKVA